MDCFRTCGRGRKDGRLPALQLMGVMFVVDMSGHGEGHLGQNPSQGTKRRKGRIKMSINALWTVLPRCFVIRRCCDKCSGRFSSVNTIKRGELPKGGNRQSERNELDGSNE